MASKKPKADGENAPVTFYSKYAKLRVVVVARTKMLVENRFVLGPGKTAEFDRGQYTTTDPEIIEFLRNDRAYGVDFFENQDALAATVQPEKNVSGDEGLEVTKPRRKPGQRAVVKHKPTTAADVDGTGDEDDDTSTDDSEADTSDESEE